MGSLNVQPAESIVKNTTDHMRGTRIMIPEGFFKFDESGHK